MVYKSASSAHESINSTTQLNSELPSSSFRADPPFDECGWPHALIDVAPTCSVASDNKHYYRQVIAIMLHKQWLTVYLQLLRLHQSNRTTRLPAQ